MKVTLIEGTPEEILDLMPHLRAPVAQAVQEPKPEQAKPADDPNEDEETTFVSTRVARRFLNRIPLNQRQKIVFRTLYHAHPKLVSAKTLQEATGYSPSQFAGLMGALGRRLTHTDGYVNDAHFFRFEWDEEQGCWLYGLPKEAHEAVQLEKLA
jgi:hypothetical protein